MERTSIEHLTSGERAPGEQRDATAGAVKRNSEGGTGRWVGGGDVVIACDRLVRIYSTAGIEVQALQGLDLLVDPGELTALVGASGSGKSTLLNILAGLDTPTAGQARVAGHDLLTMGAGDRLGYRRSVVGFLWQQTGRNLFSHLTAAENVTLPMRLAGLRRRERGPRAMELLDLVGVGYCADRMPAQMSGGEQQRVAIGIALANQPAVLLADEPTGELDSESADQVFGALRTANAELGVTILVVTHDPQVSAQVRRTIAIRDGRISTEVLRRTTVDDQGEAADIAQEYSVLDRAGRLQIPRDFIESLDMRDRVLLALEPDHVGVWPDAASPPARRAKDEAAAGPPHPAAPGQAGRGGHADGRDSVPGSQGDPA